MKIKVKVGPKRTRFINLTPELSTAVDFQLSYSLPGARFSTRYKPGGRGGWDGKRHLMFRDGISTGLFFGMKDELKRQNGITFLVKYELEDLARTDDTTQSNRQFQNDCVKAMLDTPYGGLILNATGSGKTYIAGLFFRKVAEQAVFVVDELTLLHQARVELSKVLGEPVGVIGNQEWEPQRVTVATIQTLATHKRQTAKGRATRFRKWALGVGVVIVDELHLALNRRNFKVLDSIKPKRRYGLTATLKLEHKDVRLRAYAQCGPVLYSYSLMKGVKQGYLAQGVVIMADVPSDGVATKFDHHSMYESFIMDNRPRNVRAAKIARAAHQVGHSVVVICDRPGHVRKLSRLLNDIPHRTAHGGVTSADRIKACAEFDRGKIRLLVVNRVFKKGINLKRISFIVECSGLKDPNDALQKFGRGVRLSPGKQGLIFVDIRDVFSTLGRAYGNQHPYEEAANIRKKTFKKAGLKVYRAAAKLSAEVIVQQAEKQLSKLVSK